MKKYIWLIIGVIIFLLGSYQNAQYEEKSVIVDAVITRIETDDDTDDGPISYKHTYYGEYTVDGKKYTDEKLTTKYNSSRYPDLKRGDTVEIRVYPDNPGRKVAEGGLFITVGVVMIVCSTVVLIKKERKIKI